MDLSGEVQRNLIQARNNARLASEIALHRSQLWLSESFGGGFGDVINPLSQFFDGTQPIYPLYPSRFDRRNGTNGIWVSESQLDLIRLYARFLFDTNPVAKGIVRGKRNYVYGTGFKYSIQARPNETLSEALQQQAQNILDDFLEANEWDLREPEIYTRCQRDGEAFLRLFPSDEEDYCAELRTVEPEQVRSPNLDPDWLLGLRTNPNDREKVLGYCVTYTGTLDDAEDVSPDYVQHVKINTDLAVLRGITSLFTTQELLTGTQKLLRATVEGESVRQSIAYLVEHQLADKATVQGLADLNTDWQTPVPSNVPGRTVATQHVTPGEVHEMPASRVVKPPPISDTGNATGALAAAYQALAVFFQCPAWMVSGDTGATNFAASLTAESPMVKDTLTEQKFYSNQNIKLFKKVLKIAEEQGRLPEGTVRKLAIYAECPSPAVRDAQKETDQNATLHQAGILSKKTWSEREELDYEQEAANFEDEGGTPQEQQADTDERLIQAKSNTPAAEYKQQTGGAE